MENNISINIDEGNDPPQPQAIYNGNVQNDVDVPGSFSNFIIEAALISGIHPSSDQNNVTKPIAAPQTYNTLSVDHDPQFLEFLKTQRERVISENHSQASLTSATTTTSSLVHTITSTSLPSTGCRTPNITLFRSFMDNPTWEITTGPGSEHASQNQVLQNHQSSSLPLTSTVSQVTYTSGASCTAQAPKTSSPKNNPPALTRFELPPSMQSLQSLRRTNQVPETSEQSTITKDKDQTGFMLPKKGQLRRQRSESSPPIQDAKKSKSSKDRGEVPPLVIFGDLSEFQNPVKYVREIKEHMSEHLIERINQVQNGSILIIAKDEKSRLEIFRNYPTERIFKGKTNMREGILSNSAENTLVVMNVPIEMPIEEFRAMVTEANLQTTQIIRLRDRNKCETRSIKMTLQNKDEMEYILENKLKLGYLSFNVKRFETNNSRVTRCFRCQKFNHMATACPNRLTCLRCSGNHRHTSCPNSVLKCANCEGPHAAVDPCCPAFKKELDRRETKRPHEYALPTPRSTKSTPAGRFTKSATYKRRDSPQAAIPLNKWNQPPASTLVIKEVKKCPLKSSIETEPEILMAFLTLGLITSPKQMLNLESFMKNVETIENIFKLNLDKDKLKAAVESVQCLFQPNV